MIDNRRSDFETWLVSTYGFLPDGTPCNDAVAADSPQQFLTKDGTFDMRGYEAWVERMKKQYDAITLEKLPDGSYGLCSGGFPLESDLAELAQAAEAPAKEPPAGGDPDGPRS